MPITWEEILAEGMGKGSIVDVAREGRLARLVKTSYVTVGLTLVDEAVLALVERAINQRSNVTFVYPAPAGEVSVPTGSTNTHHATGSGPCLTVGWNSDLGYHNRRSHVEGIEFR